MKNSLDCKKLLSYGKELSIFAGILLVLLFVFSCNNILMRNSGSLIIALPGARATTASLFTIKLTGTSGFNKSETLTGGTTVQFDDLVPDTYSIVVEGMDDAGTLVLSGTEIATVIAGETATVPVKLQNLLGSLTVDFVGAESDSVVEYIVTLSGPNEFKETEKVDARTVQFEGLIPGDYIVSVSGQDSDGAGVLSGTEEVTVPAGQTKSVTVELQKLLGSLTIDFSESATSSATEFKVKLNIGDTLFKSKDVSGVTSVQFDDLVPGTYDIVVEGTNEAGAVIFYGTSSETVKAGETEPADVELMKGASDFASLEAAVAAGGTVYIFNNIDVEKTLSISTDVSVIILPAYQDVTLKNTGSVDMFNVSAGNLTIGGGEHTITLDGNTLSNHAINIRSIGEVTLSSNAVIMNCGIASVKLENINYNSTYALFFLEGGTIKDNNGSGVEVRDAGKFTMNSGYIKDNNTSNGGGVNLNGGYLYLNGGSITGNNANGTDTLTGNGGGVYINSGSLYINGGSITDNTSTSNGGGVYSTKSIIMTGGLIEGNSTLGSGNGVFYNGDKGFEMSGSAVVASDNDVYLSGSKTITITGELTGGDTVATITPYTYPEATTQVQVLSLGNFTSAASKFGVTPKPDDGSQWTIDTSGNLQKKDEAQ